MRVVENYFSMIMIMDWRMIYCCSGLISGGDTSLAAASPLIPGASARQAGDQRRPRGPAGPHPAGREAVPGGHGQERRAGRGDEAHTRWARGGLPGVLLRAGHGLQLCAAGVPRHIHGRPVQLPGGAWPGLTPYLSHCAAGVPFLHAGQRSGQQLLVSQWDDVFTTGTNCLQPRPSVVINVSVFRLWLVVQCRLWGSGTICQPQPVAVPGIWTGEKLQDFILYRRLIIISHLVSIARPWLLRKKCQADIWSDNDFCCINFRSDFVTNIMRKLIFIFSC